MYAIAFKSMEEAKPFKLGDIKKAKNLIEKANFFKGDTRSTIEALAFSIGSGNLELIKYLESQGWLDICKKDKSCLPIHFTSRPGIKIDKRKPIIECLTLNGFNPNTLNSNGMRTLNYAVKYAKEFELVKYLCAIGVNTNIKGGYKKRTPLESAESMSGAMFSSDINQHKKIKNEIDKIIIYLKHEKYKKNISTNITRHSVDSENRRSYRHLSFLSTELNR